MASVKIWQSKQAAGCNSSPLSTKTPHVSIGPSILKADLSDLSNVCADLFKDGADYMHLDVMDGHFVPNLTFGHTVVKCLRNKVRSVFFDMHMMVSKPEMWIQPMADAGADLYTFHVEATENPTECARKIKEAGLLAGIGIKPNTPVESVYPVMEIVDVVLIMTVEPGFGGQKFMADMMPKVRDIRQKFPTMDIEVDGGVGPSNIQLVAENGANLIVSGSAITDSSEPGIVMKHLRDTCNSHLLR